MHDILHLVLTFQTFHTHLPFIFLLTFSLAVTVTSLKSNAVSCYSLEQEATALRILTQRFCVTIGFISIDFCITYSVKVSIGSPIFKRYTFNLYYTLKNSFTHKNEYYTKCSHVLGGVVTTKCSWSTVEGWVVAGWV